MEKWTGERIKKLRERLGLTQLQFGVKVAEVMELPGGKDSSSISDWENDKYVPSTPAIYALEKIKAEAEQAGKGAA